MASTLPAPAAARAALTGELMSLLPEIKRRFQATLPATLRDQLGGATPHQLEALHLLTLTAGPEGMRGATMNELARGQQCALSTATALVDRLMRQGLAERVSDPNDRRVVRIAPTTLGEDVCEQFATARQSMLLHLVDVLDDKELETLVGLLRKVTTASMDHNVGEEVQR